MSIALEKCGKSENLRIFFKGEKSGNSHGILSEIFKKFSDNFAFAECLLLGKT